MMRTVMKAIFQAKRQYATLPLFEFMRDESLSPRERLSFYPCMAPFILAFGDLNKYVMREEPSSDHYQRLVNQHTYEDDHHWPWYLEDLTTLGLDPPSTLSQSLLFLYSDHAQVNRMLAMRLAHMLYDASPIERLVIIEAIEETGNVLFALTAQLARRIEMEEQITLRYLGDFHFNLETGHAMSGAEHAELAAIPLDEIQRERCLEHVANVFRHFEEWTDELLGFANAAVERTAIQPGAEVVQLKRA